MKRSLVGDWISQRFRLTRGQDNANSTASGQTITADAPIRSAADDKLRRVRFACRIADVLCERFSDEGRVFAIRAAWGDGKTSLKNLVIEELARNPTNADWLDFNPWQWGDSDAIARALFQQIADKLGGPYSGAAARRAKKLRQYGSILTGVGEPLRSSAFSAQTIATVLASGAVVALASADGLHLPKAANIAAIMAILAMLFPFSGRVLRSFGKDRTAEPLDEIRSSLEQSLRDLRKPLIVFVDDIDRLEPDKIRLLFRQIKANANLPNIVFVMLFQPSIAEAALDDITDKQGRKFLEKIVQANFDLPSVPRSTVHQIFTEELSSIANAYATPENGFETVRWGNVLIGCIHPYVENLRDARRLISSIAIHLPLHVSENAFEVNIIDFLALETLRVFEPDFHRAIFENREFLLQKERYHGNSSAERDRAERLLLVVPETKREAARETIKNLFPVSAWVFGGTNYSEGWDARWISEKRVGTKRYFPQYFELQTPEGEISESSFAEFIAASSDRERLASLIADAEDRGLLTSLAARLDESVKRLPKENASIVLPAIFSIGEKLSNADTADPFNAPFVNAWRAASWYVDGLPKEERGAAMLSALKETNALSMAAVLIHLEDPADRKDEERSTFEPKIDGAALQALKNEWLSQVRDLAAGDKLLGRADLANILYRWRDYTGSLDEPRSWVEATSKTDERFGTLISSLVTTGTTQSMGDRVARRVDRFDRQTIEDFIGLRQTRNRLDALQNSRVMAAHENALNVLRQHLDQWDSKAPTDAG